MKWVDENHYIPELPEPRVYNWHAEHKKELRVARIKYFLLGVAVVLMAQALALLLSK
jgi:hypothetical protein